MHYKPLSAKESEFPGESFGRDLKKDDNSLWGSTEGAYYEMFNSAGELIVTNTLVKSADELLLTFFIEKEVTEPLIGNHRLLVHATDSDNLSFDDVIAEYKIEYIQHLE